jgi:hypothetical protein
VEYQIIAGNAGWPLPPSLPFSLRYDAASCFGATSQFRFAGVEPRGATHLYVVHVFWSRA